jgi:hypothetical protein
MPKFDSLRIFALWMTVALLLALQHVCYADASSASLTVSIADSSGAVVPSAKIVLRNMETSQEQHAITDKAGGIAFSFLKPGHYSLTVSKANFSDIAVDNIQLNVGDEKHLALTLKVGATTQSVTVDGTGLNINTANGSVSTVVDRQFVANVPLNGRSFQDLISMTPGVVTQSPQNTNQSIGYLGDFSINGQRTESNYYMVDGVSANTNTGPAQAGSSPANGGVVAAGSALGTTQTLLSVDALQEFRVNSSTYSAEYGRSPGGQISFLSRSGTNNFHGTVFDYLRNGWFDANDWFNDELGQPKEELHQNDFGGTLGGPVWIPGLYKGADRTFFFGSYEGFRLTQPTAASIQYVPDVYMRDQAPSPVQALLNAFPRQSANGIDYGTEQAPSLAQFFQGYSLPGSIDSTSLRLDHTFTPALSSFFRFSDTPSSVESRALSSLASSEVNSRTYTFATTYVLTSAMTDEFRLGYTTGDSLYDSNLDNFGGAVPLSLGSAMNLIPYINSFPGVYLSLSGVGYTNLQTQNAENRGRQWNIIDTLALNHDTHQLKFGFDYRRITTTVVRPPVEANVEWTGSSQVLTNSATFADIYKFLDATSIYNQIAAFAQDEWKVNARLSLSLGVRWEVDPPPYSGSSTKPYIVEGNLSQPANLTLSAAGVSLWKTPRWNFAPRLGVAWQPHSTSGRETVLRAGGGLFFDTDNEAAEQGFQTVGYSALQEFSNVAMPFTGTQNDFPITVAPPYAQAVYYPSHLQLPYTLEWSTAVEQGLGQSQTISLTYAASAGRRLIQEQEVIPSNPNFKAIFYIPGGVTSNYQSLQAKLQRQMAKGLSGLVSYTWSHSLDYGSTFESLPLTYGNSDYDVRSNLQAGVTWELAHTASTSLANTLLGGWGLDGRLLARTAFPITLQGKEVIDPGTGSVYYTNVNVIAGEPIYIYGPHYPGGRLLNRAAFDLPAGSEEGSAARNFVRGFGANQLNLALRRRFSLGDRLSLQFRAEAFNILNHPNFGYVDPTLSDATFGYATQTLDQSLGTVASQYQQGGPRSMQFALRLIF